MTDLNHNEPHQEKQLPTPRKRRMRRLRPQYRLILSITILACVLFSGVATYAFLNTVTNRATNALTIATLKVDVVEDFNGWNKKTVQLKNSSTTAEGTTGIVRTMIIPTVTDAQGTNGRPARAGEFTKPVNNKMVLGDFTFEFAPDWETNWFFKEGFFYYRKPLIPGEITQPCLTKVSLTVDTPEVRARYKDCAITVDVLADILQSEGNAPQEAWGVQVINGIVSPL